MAVGAPFLGPLPMPTVPGHRTGPDPGPAGRGVRALPAGPRGHGGSLGAGLLRRRQRPPGAAGPARAVGPRPAGPGRLRGAERGRGRRRRRAGRAVGRLRLGPFPAAVRRPGRGRHRCRRAGRTHRSALGGGRVVQRHGSRPGLPRPDAGHLAAGSGASCSPTVCRCARTAGTIPAPKRRPCRRTGPTGHRASTSPWGRWPTGPSRCCGRPPSKRRRWAPRSSSHAVRRGDPELLGELPANVHLSRYLPQAALLPTVDVIVHHGGAGTMLTSAAHGIPQVVLPQGADQFINAESVQAAGVGRRILKDGPGSGSRRRGHRGAARRVPRAATAAALLRDEIAGMPSPDEVATQLLDRL